MVHPRRLSDATLMDAIHQMIARAPLAQFEAQIQALLARPDRSALLPQIRVPTLVLCGHEDNWSPIGQHVEMARRIRRQRAGGCPGLRAHEHDGAAGSDHPCVQEMAWPGELTMNNTELACIEACRNLIIDFGILHRQRPDVRGWVN